MDMRSGLILLCFGGTGLCLTGRNPITKTARPRGGCARSNVMRGLRNNHYGIPILGKWILAVNQFTKETLILSPLAPTRCIPMTYLGEMPLLCPHRR